jgi:hypothetical protein
MKKIPKKFDAVAMMRSIRDKVSRDISCMTLEEEQTWLASRKIEDPFLSLLRDRAVQQSNATNSAIPRR